MVVLEVSSTRKSYLFSFCSVIFFFLAQINEVKLDSIFPLYSVYEHFNFSILTKPVPAVIFSSSITYENTTLTRFLHYWFLPGDQF